MRCPHCKTEIRALVRPDECKHCGRPLKDGDGQSIREMDRDYPGLLARLDEQTKERIKKGLIVCAAIAAVNLLAFVPLMQWLLVIVPVALVIQHVIWARTLVCAPYARHFSLGRRVVSRWLSRFFVLTTATFHVNGVVPGVPVVVSPVILLATCGTVWWYHRFHLEREHRREPVHFVEKVLLIVAAVVLVVTLVGLVLLIMFLASIFEKDGA